MKHPAQRVVPRVSIILVSVFLMVASVARAQFVNPTPGTRSISGQFIINSGNESSALLHNTDIATNANYVRIEPALLAVSAERFRAEFLRLLGQLPNAPWTGNIILSLRPARTPDETATLTVGPLVRSWACQVELPDIITVPRYGRALCSALLLEYADRSSKDMSHVPELPSWLADGLGRLVIASDTEKIILSAPAHTINGLPQSRMADTERGIDPMAGARKVLQNNAALTFDQLCWPEPAQLDGEDSGVYAASSQLFTASLLALPDGQALMRSFLSKLPGVLNWQTAFYAVYHDYFRKPLDVDKWWSLQVVRFAVRDPGPHWTTAVSQDRLDEILAVPVEYRMSSNSLPVHTEVSLQAVILNFNWEERRNTLDLKLRDLRLAELRLAPPFAGLAAGYIKALEDFLGEGPRKTWPQLGRMSENAPRTVSAKTTLQKLDQLDALRRNFEIQISNSVPKRSPK